MIDEKYYPEPGDTVTWTSQAIGTEKTKTGKVIAIVPAGEDVSKLLPEVVVKNHIKYSSSISTIDRVLVAVPAGKDKQTIHYYTPRVSAFAREGLYE